MRFHVRAIKEVANIEYNINCILSMPDNQVLMAFLKANNILAISQKQYNKEPHLFWDIYWSLLWENSYYDFVIDDTRIDRCLYTMCYMWWDIVAINSYSNNMSAEEGIASIKNTQRQVSDEKEKDKEKMQILSEHIARSYTNKNTEKLYASINKILDDILFAQDTYKQTPEISKKLANASEELKKMRLSKNTEKIHEIVTKIYDYIALMEEWYLTTLPKDNIDPESAISLGTFIGKYDKRERAQKLSEAGRWDSLYSQIWSIIIWMQFLFYDIQHRFLQWWSQPERVFWDIGTIILSSIVLSTFWAILLILFEWWKIETILWLGLIQMGTIGIVMWILKIITKKTLIHTGSLILISIFVFICLHYSIMWLLLIH